MPPNCQGRDPIIFEAAIKIFIVYRWPTQLTHLLRTDFAVSYRNALDRLRVRLNIKPILCFIQHNVSLNPTSVPAK